MSNHNLDEPAGPSPAYSGASAGAPDPGGKCVVYWMQRAQRGVDNPALNLAIALGNAMGLPVLAVFGLTADYPGASAGITGSWWRAWLMRRTIWRRTESRWSFAWAVRMRSWPSLPQRREPPLVVGDENPVRIRRRGSSRPLEARGAVLPRGRRRGCADVAVSEGRIRRRAPPPQDPSGLGRLSQAASQPGGAKAWTRHTPPAWRSTPTSDGEAQGRGGARGGRLSWRHARGREAAESVRERAAGPLCQRSQ